MGTYFLDTSAIVKRYVPAEQGHVWITALCHPAHGHKLFISQAALVETVATICRKAREQSITMAQRDRLIGTFRQDSQDSYSIMLVTTGTYTSAGDLCRTHRLRAYDAVQLASALDLREEALADELAAPIFVCADVDLSNVATAEGLGVENP